jgi:hypothetical protein
MRRRTFSKKLLLIIIGVFSLVVWSESRYDQDFYSASFIDEVTPLVIEEVEIAERRNVASFVKKKLPRVRRDLTLDKRDQFESTEWEIIRIVDDKGVVQYDKNSKEDNRDDEIIVNFEMINVATLRVVEDEDQIYKINFYNEQFGTLALFKEYGKGYEILEAQRVRRKREGKNLSQAGVDTTTNRNVEPDDSELSSEEKRFEKIARKFNIESDLMFYSAVDPIRNRAVLYKNFSGNAYLTAGNLTLENIILHEGTKNQTEPVSAIADVNEYGAFVTEDYSGVVNVLNGNELKVTIHTKDKVLQNAVLIFVTEEKLEELNGIKNRNSNNNENYFKNEIDEELAQENERVELAKGERDQFSEFQNEEEAEEDEFQNEEEGFENERDEQGDDEEFYEEEEVVEVKTKKINRKVAQIGFTF